MLCHFCGSPHICIGHLGGMVWTCLNIILARMAYVNVIWDGMTFNVILAGMPFSKSFLALSLMLSGHSGGIVQADLATVVTGLI